MWITTMWQQSHLRQIFRWFRINHHTSTKKMNSALENKHHISTEIHFQLWTISIEIIHTNNPSTSQTIQTYSSNSFYIRLNNNLNQTWTPTSKINTLIRQLHQRSTFCYFFVIFCPLYCLLSLNVLLLFKHFLYFKIIIENCFQL